MSVKGIWGVNATVLASLVIINILLMSLGNTYWTILGVLALLGGAFISLQRGMQMGHAACGVSHLIDQANESGHSDRLDEKTLAKAWSRGNGIRSVLLSALIPYGCSCLYMLVVLLNIEGLIVPTRLPACLMALPFWSIIPGYSFPSLAAPVIAVLMVSPFVLPLFTFAGYMRGPKLWQNTEKAMAEGRRRAKAKARIAQKRKPRQQKPEI